MEREIIASQNIFVLFSDSQSGSSAAYDFYLIMYSCSISIHPKVLGNSMLASIVKLTILLVLEIF